MEDQNIICVVTCGDLVVRYSVNKNTPMRYVKEVHAENLGTAVRHVHFMYNFSLVMDNDTFATLNMRDNDTIRVYVAPQLE